MNFSLRRRLAIILFRFPFALNLVVRLYPIAMEKKYADVSQENYSNLLRLIAPREREGVNLIRIGSVSDGGYVVHNDFSLDDILVSLGIGDNSDFEYELSSKVETIKAYDHTVKQIPRNSVNIDFYRLGVKAKAEEGFVTLRTIIEQIPSTHDLILKIDIEGWEWEVLDGLTDEELLRFRQIIGEFHDFHDVGKLESIEGVIRRLASNFTVINSHANNWGKYDLVKSIAVPDVVEITWLRNNFSSSKSGKGKSENDSVNKANNPLGLDLGYNLFQ